MPGSVIKVHMHNFMTYQDCVVRPVRTAAGPAEAGAELGDGGLTENPRFRARG